MREYLERRSPLYSSWGQDVGSPHSFLVNYIKLLHFVTNFLYQGSGFLSILARSAWVRVILRASEVH